MNTEETTALETAKGPAATGANAQPQPQKSLDELVIGADQGAYGDDYKAHLLEQYKLYVEMADKISERRQAANTYFFTVCTALITALGVVWPKSDGLMGTFWFVAVAVAGILLSVFWNRSLWSYRNLNGAKFKVVHALERMLPVRPYDTEWEALGRGEDKVRYWPLSHIETRVPWVFGFIFLTIAILALIIRT